MNILALLSLIFAFIVVMVLKFINNIQKAYPRIREHCLTCLDYGNYCDRFCYVGTDCHCQRPECIEEDRRARKT
jgi:hypothetical protein